MRCSPICTARSACWLKAWCRRSCHSAIRISCGRVTASGRAAAPLAHLCRRSRARARRALVGARRSHAGAVGRGLCAREPRDRRAGASRSRYATSACAAFAASSASCVHSMLSRCRRRREVRTPSCSRRDRSTKPISSTRISRGSSDCRWSRGRTSRVRGDTVYLKTLGGLRRVHAILRRLDDDYLRSRRAA